MDPKSAVRSPKTLLILAAIVILGLTGTIIGMVVSGDDDGDAPSTADAATVAAPAAQIASVQRACYQWLAADPDHPDDRAWCSRMTDWMSQHVAGTPMGPQMMWNSPDQLRATCRDWISDRPNGVDGPVDDDWCDHMVGWMQGHMAGWSGHNDWDGWVMHGPHHR